MTGKARIRTPSITVFLLSHFHPHSCFLHLRKLFSSKIQSHSCSLKSKPQVLTLYVPHESETWCYLIYGQRSSCLLCVQTPPLQCHRGTHQHNIHHLPLACDPSGPASFHWEVGLTGKGGVKTFLLIHFDKMKSNTTEGDIYNPPDTTTLYSERLDGGTCLGLGGPIAPPTPPLPLLGNSTRRR